VTENYSFWSGPETSTDTIGGEGQGVLRQAVREVALFRRIVAIPQMERHTAEQAYFLVQSDSALCREQGCGVCAVCDDADQPRRDRGDGAALVGAAGRQDRVRQHGGTPRLLLLNRVVVNGRREELSGFFRVQRSVRF
jgi:hypothetical protein